MDNESHYAHWFPIDSHVEIELTAQSATCGILLCGTVVLITRLGVIIAEGEAPVLVPWRNISLMRATTGAGR